MSIPRYRTDTVGNAVDKCASVRAKLHTWVVSEPPLHNEAARAADRGRRGRCAPLNPPPSGAAIISGRCSGGGEAHRRNRSSSERRGRRGCVLTRHVNGRLHGNRDAEKAFQSGPNAVPPLSTTSSIAQVQRLPPRMARDAVRA